MSNKVIQLTGDTYQTEVLESDIPVLVDFYADWCGPCQMVTPVIDAMAEKYEGKIKFCKINIDEQKATAITNKVMSIPTLFFVKDGAIVERVMGAIPEPAMDEKIQALL